MAGLFVVYLVAILVIVFGAERPAEPMARLRVLANSAADAGKAVHDRGTEVLEVIAAWLAADRRSRPATMPAEQELLGGIATRTERRSSQGAPGRPVHLPMFEVRCLKSDV